MQKAGVDGVEVHAAHAHGMLGGFLSPQYNKRTDEYGGSLDARMRFLLEVIAEIRERCGRGFIIDVRLSGDEYTDGGLTLNDMIYVSRRLEKAGVDMLHVSGGTTINFLSPQYNKRTDEYGGSLDARMRFLLEVIAEIRERCGKDFIIDVRISGDEYTDGGLTLNDMIYVSRRLEKAGVDMIHVSGGTTIKRGSAIPAAGTKQARHADLSREIKKHVKIPVATVGRINEAWIAEELIEDGAADICMMGRANLCDAEFCNKAAAGRAEEVRPCIGCLRCLNGIMFGKPISCTATPTFRARSRSM